MNSATLLSFINKKEKNKKTNWREYYFNGSLDNQRRQAK